MTQKILGPEGSKRRMRFWLVPMLLVALATIFWVTAAQAVHDTGAFQLDGNAQTSLQSTPPASDDWDRVCHQVSPTACPSGSNTTGATAVDWTDDGSLNASIFTGGGSKDPQNIDQWAWKDGAGGLPDKDNLLHSFAARYSLPDSTTCPAGTAATCEVLFFGSDRYDNSGDAQQGFWFFQNKITLGSTALGGGTSFNGLHKNGDLLIISNFSNGGTTSTISVYTWDSTVSGNLKLLATSAAAKCTSAAAGDGFCGIVNPGNITMPWAFTDKSGTAANGSLNGEFYEGGVNLSTLGLANECFASVASETRSSTSTTATLKDFVLGNFGKCESGLTTQASGTAATIGTGSTSSGTDSATLTISGTPSWTGNLKFYLCGPIAATAKCDANGYLVTDTTATNASAKPFVSGSTILTSAGHYCWFAKFTSGTTGVPDATDDGTNECFDVAKVLPTLATSASSSPNSLVGATVSDTATLSGAATAPGTNGSNTTYPSINATPGTVGGSISWVAYGPGGTPAGCSNVALASTSRTVNGNGTYPKAAQSPVSFTANAIGTYTFVASYDSGGNANTDNVPASACPDTTGTEAVTITGTASLSTAQDWLPNDTATLTGDAHLNGTLTFTLYNDGSCGGGTGTSQYTKSVTVTDAASGSTFSTDNATHKVTATGSWSWKVHYVDSVLTSPTDSCEKTAVTITN